MEVAQYYLRNGTPVIATLCGCTAAFDKCQFDILFVKLLARDVPGIVVRLLIFVYQEQVAWVKWGNVKSRQFQQLCETISAKRVTTDQTFKIQSYDCWKSSYYLKA